jgi:hypothetical protein
MSAHHDPRAIVDAWRDVDRDLAPVVGYTSGVAPRTSPFNLSADPAASRTFADLLKVSE